MIDFKVLQEALARFHYPDPALLNNTGLRKLVERYDAYPMALDNQSMCVLLPAKLSPQKAARLTETKAATQIIVLRKKQTKWLKVWPSEELVRKAQEEEQRQRDEALALAQNKAADDSVIIIEDESA